MLKVDNLFSYPSFFLDAHHSPLIPTMTRGTIKSDDITVALKIRCATNKRFIEINGTTCDTIGCLIKTAPSLKSRPKLLAHIINYLAQGELFSVIDDPEAFRKKYSDTLRREYEEDNLQGLAGYGLFHVEEITTPRVKDNTCVFYAEKKNGVPQRITCTLSDPLPHIKYETLRSSF
jgi:hypothetical protein